MFPFVVRENDAFERGTAAATSPHMHPSQDAAPEMEQLINFHSFSFGGVID